MRSRRPSPEHQEAVTRRLALLSAELATVRPAAGDEPEPEHAHTRIRAVPESSLSSDPVDPLLPIVPVPGRHARPGFRATLADLVPETLRGRASIGPGAVTVVVLVLCAALGLTCWWLVRSDPQEVAAPEVAAPLVDVPASEPIVGSPAAVVPGAGPTEVTVDVAGKVRHPGIAVLPAGARVIDALDAAGGARRGIDLTSLNLARPLVDGEQVLVGLAPGPGTAAATAPGGAAPGALVNINTADQATLETLSGVGPVTAQAIIAWRTEHGGFTAVVELLEVDGIGDATLEQLTPHVTI